MTPVRQWSGREAAALRTALRLSVRAYADHLGVAPRTVAKWEALGGGTHPRPDTQAILDTALSRADADVRARFVLLLASDGVTSSAVVATGYEPEYETWEEDLERIVVNVSRQHFGLASGLLNRWLVRYDPHDLDERGLYLYGRSLTLLGDVRRDQGQLVGQVSAHQPYQRARRVFQELDIPWRMAQIDLSMVVLTEMAGSLEAAARHYERLVQDERLSRRNRARAQLWVGTALDKAGRHDYATEVMVPAAQLLADLNEADDWIVAQQKIALAYRGAGKIEKALHYIGLAKDNSTPDTPMQRVRLDTAQAHILLTDKATQEAGLSLLASAKQVATQYGMAHQRASIQRIRAGFERAGSKR